MFGIIGASGFIGRSMADFLNAGRIPYCAFLRKYDPAARVHFNGAKSVQCFEIGRDLNPEHFLGIDTLLITAWATKPNTSGNSIEHEWQLNIQPHIQFLKSLLKTRVKHLIFLSSGGAVYGQASQPKNVSEHTQCRPCTPYGIGKLQIEKAIQRIWAAKGRRFTIIRPSNPVGRHQMRSVGQHGLFPSVIHAMIRGLPVHIFGDGHTVRDYFAVEDLISLIWAANEQDIGNQIVNASSGKGLSIKHVVDLCSAATSKIPQIIYHHDKQPAIDYNVLCNKRAANVFSWSPERPITEIARKLVNAMQTLDGNDYMPAEARILSAPFLQKANHLTGLELKASGAKLEDFGIREFQQKFGDYVA